MSKAKDGSVRVRRGRKGFVLFKPQNGAPIIKQLSSYTEHVEKAPGLSLK